MSQIFKTKKILSAFAWTMVFILMIFDAQAGAGTITLTPETEGMISRYIDPPGNCEAGCVYDAFDLENDGSLLSLYKSEQNNEYGGLDSGLFKDDYSTVFLNTSSDPQDATISWDGQNFINCLECYLVVKDGNTDPNYYFFNLSQWNGKDTIKLLGFWPQQGAISHVSIWGKTKAVPEPTTVFLLGTGLLVLCTFRKKIFPFIYK